MIVSTEIEFGVKYRDGVTGYEGTAEAVTEFHYGCLRIQLERADKDGKPETEWFDEQRLVKVDTNMRAGSHSGAGGPRDHEPQRSDHG